MENKREKRDVKWADAMFVEAMRSIARGLLMLEQYDGYMLKIWELLGEKVLPRVLEDEGDAELPFSDHDPVAEDGEGGAA